jgi:cell division protein FtsW
MSSMMYPYRHHSDRLLLLLTIGLTLFGVVMIYSASVLVGHNTFGNDRHFVNRQIVWTILGCIGLFTAANIDYRRWQKWSGAMLVATLALLVSVFLFSKGEINGAHRWIEIFGQSFQPSELAKFTLIAYLSGWLAERRDAVRSITGTFLPFLTVIGIVSFLMLLQPDFGTLLIMVGAATAVYFAAGMTWQQFILGTVVLALSGVAVASSSEYRMNRIKTFFNPQSDTSGISYHVYNISIAIGSGGPWGLGFGESKQKRGFLPEPQTDSIFAVITEELGAIRSVLVIVAFALLGLRGFRIAALAPDRYGQLLAAGITAWFSIQAFMNLGAMLHLVPLVGIPLPFISYGGTNLIISLTAMGVLLNISRQTGPTEALTAARGRAPARSGNGNTGSRKARR